MIQAVVFSDHHLDYWNKYNKNGRRTKVQLEILESLFVIAQRHKVPILMGGDLYHNPNDISNELGNMVNPQFRSLFAQYPDVHLYAISGNHDLSGLNTLTLRSPSHINMMANTFENFHNLDFETLELKNLVIHGIPYITGNQDYQHIIDKVKVHPKKYNILLNHTDYRGQKDTNGIVVGKGENIEEGIFKKFDKVLSGHIHKGGKLNKKVISIGSTMQNRFSDMGGAFGYWIIRKKGRKVSFIFREITNTPKFRLYTKESEIDNDFDFWVKAPKDAADIESLVALEDLGSQPKQIMKGYYKSHKVSRSKKVLLNNLINQAIDED